MFKNFFILFLFIFSNANAQENTKNDTLNLEKNQSKFKLTSLIIPSSLVTYGFVGLNNSTLKSFDENIRSQIVTKNYQKTNIDNFTTLAPAAAVYILNFAGIEGKHDIKDRSIVIASSYAIAGTSTFMLKNITKRERPDASTANSFPSGHTAFAFASAEFLWQEYKEVSVWYGISGYILASSTGFLRMYNNRHWFSDVAIGAGIGILSTKFAYLLLPIINDKIFTSKNKKVTYIITPFYQEKKVGLGFVMHL